MRTMPGPLTDCYCRDGSATCAQCETNGYPYSWGLCPGCDLHNGIGYEADKHLTDAECAAEYWGAVALFQYTRLDPVGDPEMAQQAAWSEVEVWHRFATHEGEM